MKNIFTHISQSVVINYTTWFGNTLQTYDHMSQELQQKDEKDLVLSQQPERSSLVYSENKSLGVLKFVIFESGNWIQRKNFKIFPISLRHCPLRSLMEQTSLKDRYRVIRQEENLSCGMKTADHDSADYKYLNNTNFKSRQLLLCKKLFSCGAPQVTLICFI